MASTAVRIRLGSHTRDLHAASATHQRRERRYTFDRVGQAALEALKRNHLSATLPFLVLQVVEDGFYVVIKLRRVLLAELSDFFNDGIFPHALIPDVLSVEVPADPARAEAAVGAALRGGTDVRVARES